MSGKHPTLCLTHGRLPVDLTNRYCSRSSLNSPLQEGNSLSLPCIKRKLHLLPEDPACTVPANWAPPSGRRRAGCRLPWLQLPWYRPLWLCQRSACTGPAESVDGTRQLWYLEGGGEESSRPAPLAGSAFIRDFQSGRL